MNVTGVSGKSDPRLSPEEEQALAKNESTSTVVSRARAAAGQRGEEVVVRGDDKTLDEHLREYKTHIGVGKKAAAIMEAGEVATGLGLSLGAAFAVAAPISTWIAGQIAMAEMQYEKDGRRDIATRDTLHAAILQSLDVPEGFRQAEIQRHGVTMTARSPAKKIADQILMSPGARATLQLHCDQGMTAARDMIEGRVDKDAFLKANPKVAERYASDAAFKNGFDAVVWAKKTSDATYAETIQKLEARDARYAATQVTVRL